MVFIFFKKNKKAFTLIELLVVISIIGILSMVVFSAINKGIKKAKGAALVSQLQEIEKAFIMTYFDENRSTWWRESEIGLGPNPTLKKIIEKETGALSTFSDYFRHKELKDTLANGHYRYDNDNDTGASCGGGVSNWSKGVNLAITGISLEQKKYIDKYIDKEINFKCGKIVYGNYEGGSLYWRISDKEAF